MIHNKFKANKLIFQMTKTKQINVLVPSLDIHLAHFQSRPAAVIIIFTQMLRLSVCPSVLPLLKMKQTLQIICTSVHLPSPLDIDYD